MPKCQINNKFVVVKEGTKIIEVADLLKISIPRFCYHPRLSIAANCRICLVEVNINSVSKLLPGCSTEIQEGMQIFTDSTKTIASQKAVIELLLVNHPLECPICEQAGECELQNLSLQVGKSIPSDHDYKRTTTDANLGPLITSHMNRCINCTRCIRFEEEISGVKELALLNINKSIKVTTINNSVITSEMSGNMIDLCPVGALSAKPLLCRYKPWELKERFGISMHDCIGSNISYHVNYNEEIKRAVAKENNKINCNWLSDRDRFGFLANNSQERLKYPIIKKNKMWCVATWEEALEFVNQNLNKVISQYGGEELGTLVSPSATLEEYYFLKVLVKNLGSNNIDYRLRQIDFREPVGLNWYPYLGINSIENLNKQKFVLLIGSYLNKEQPIAAMHLRQAVLNGCKVVTINPMACSFNFKVHQSFIPANADLLIDLLKITKALLEISDMPTLHEIINDFDFLNEIIYENTHLKVAEIMLTSYNEQSSIILGGLSISHPEFSSIVAICQIISKIINANLGCFPYGANSLGAHLIGCVPELTTTTVAMVKDIKPLNASEMLQNTLKAYILFGIEPELDCAYGINSINIFKRSELVIAFTAYESQILMEYCDILLPMALPQESGGTYINVTGTCQKFKKIAANIGESKPAIEILNKMANYFGYSIENQFNNSELSNNITSKIEDLRNNNPTKIIEKINIYKFYFNHLKNNIFNSVYNDQINYICNDAIINDNGNKKINLSLLRIAPISLYAVDPVIRRANDLQETIDAKVQAIINPKSANYLNIYNNQLITIDTYNKKFNFNIKISSDIPEGCILINQVNLETLISIPYEKISIKASIIDNFYV